MTTWTIYCHTHIASGRRYVGLTKLNMMKRWNRHVYNSTASTKKGWSHFANAIRAYGKDAFSHEVLETCDTLEAANAAEEKWIAFHDTRNPERGFNLLRGGSHTPHLEKRNPWERDGFKEKVSSTMKEWFKDPANAVAHSARSKEINSRPEVRKRQSETTSLQFADPAARARMSETIAARHQDPAIAAGFRKGLETANRNRREKTHCKNGHEFTPENTRRDGKGWRYCRRCAADRALEKKRRLADRLVKLHA